MIWHEQFFQNQILERYTNLVMSNTGPMRSNFTNLREYTPVDQATLLLKNGLKENTLDGASQKNFQENFAKIKN